MTGPHHAIFYLPEPMLKSARAGKHNFIGKVESVLRGAGIDVGFRDPCEAGHTDKGLSLFHMQEPLNPRGLTIRRAYYYPFWQIQRTNERWHWDVAHADFSQAEINQKEARWFFDFWQKRLYKEHLSNVTRDGFVYVPLQGRLLEKRSFQGCSPLQMIHDVLEQEPTKKVIASLHPKEVYHPDEIAALEALEQSSDRLEVHLGGMEDLLSRCDYVATQNSSVAFAGFFFGKPCVLFARVDFHHIAANVSELGVKGAFERVRNMTPDYAGYVWWFLQSQSINAGRPEAEDRIRERLLALGWPV